jgi:predicted  nucleic acid-binding Zn-ribbon protein
MTESTAPASLAELDEAIAELQAYRDRLVSDMTAMAQKAKISKSQMMANLEPELQQIDKAIEGLQVQKSSLAAIRP